MRLLSTLFLICAASALSAGTIIYKTEDGKQNIMSDVEIMTIDGNMVTLKIGKAKRNIGKGALIKYYDTDIKLSGLFEDGTAEYDVSILDAKMPLTGMVKNKTRKSIAEAEFEFTISRKGEGVGDKNVRVPLFYLFVLVHGKADYGGYDMYVYSYPEAAKNSAKDYNEALMLERVLSADRPLIYSGVAGKLAQNEKPFASARKATFKLSGIGDRRILAYYLVVWGKTWIVTEKEERSSESRVGDRWWVRYND